VLLLGHRVCQFAQLEFILYLQHANELFVLNHEVVRDFQLLHEYFELPERLGLGTEVDSCEVHLVHLAIVLEVDEGKQVFGQTLSLVGIPHVDH